MDFVQRSPDKAYMDLDLWVPKKYVNTDVIKRALTLTDLDGHGNRIFALYQELEHHLLVPREFWRYADWPDDLPIIDCRPTSYPTSNLRSKIQLDIRGGSIQNDAFNAMTESDGGILHLACGRGKTIIALHMIASSGHPGLIAVDTLDLLRNWKEKALQFLDIQEEDIGIIQGSHFDWKKPLVLATYMTLANKADSFQVTDEFRRHFANIFWDEGHHVAAPVFSKSANMFYGRRIALTATPFREDGLHLITNYHLGQVFYKNLTQDLTPEIWFMQTGYRPDFGDPGVRLKTHDVTGELHLKKLAGYMGRDAKRLDIILNIVREQRKEDRKILVVSESVDELVNLACRWIGIDLIQDSISMPTWQEIGAKVPGRPLSPRDLRKCTNLVNNEHKSKQTPNMIDMIQDAKERLASHEVYLQMEREYERRRLEYIHQVLKVPADVGVLFSKVKTNERSNILNNKNVVFCISRFGREALDCPALDTVIVCEPIANKGGIQQVMGRALRPKDGKKNPRVIFLEDRVEQFMGMCQKMKRMIRKWPADEGGPYKYEVKTAG